MRYILSLISLVLIGVLGFQLGSVSAVAVIGTISGEKRVVIVSPKVQLLKLKRALIEAKKKVTLLKVRIAALKKQIELKVKRGLVATAFEKRLETLMAEFDKAEQTVSDIQKNIDATGSGATN